MLLRNPSECAVLFDCPAAGAAQLIGNMPGTGAQRSPAPDAGNSGGRAAALAAELQSNQDAMVGTAAERRQVLLHPNLMQSLHYGLVVLRFDSRRQWCQGRLSPHMILRCRL